VAVLVDPRLIDPQVFGEFRCGQQSGIQKGLRASMTSEGATTQGPPIGLPPKKMPGYSS
jgi:hypothetical protein